MKFKLNGKQQEIANQDGFSIAHLVKEKKLDSNSIVIEYNLEIVPQGKWDKIILKQNDRIEIVSFVGGG